MVPSAVSVAPLGIPASVVGALVDGRFQATRPGGDERRQEAPEAVRLTGGVYVTRRDLLDEGRLLDELPAAMTTNGGAAIDVDGAEDLAAVRRAWRAQRAGRT